MEKTKIQIQVAEHICSGCLLIGNEFVIDPTDDDLINASTDYRSVVDIVDEDDERYNEYDCEQDHEEDYGIKTIEIDGYDKDEVINTAFHVFSDRAKYLGYSNVYNIVNNNYRHGVFVEDHGRCSMNILAAFNPENDVLGLRNEEIKRLCESMDIAADR